MRIDAAAISLRTAAVLANPIVVMAFMLLSIACAAGCVLAPSWNVFGAFLGMLGLAATSAILCEGKQRDDVARDRDVALHEKIDALIHGTDADDGKAGIERAHPDGA